MSEIALVLLPGMDGSGLLFAPLLKELPDWVKPVVVSYPPDKPLDYSGHLDVVLAVLPKDQPYVVLGESFSGPLALMVAARHPTGLKGIILCASFATWPLPFSPKIVSVMVALGAFRWKLPRLFSWPLLGNSATSELRRLLAEALAHTTADVLAARVRAVTNVDCRASLRESQAPLLVMVADHDRIVARRCSELIQNIRPDAEVVHINAPHLLLQCAPVEAARHISRFIEEGKSTWL